LMTFTGSISEAKGAVYGHNANSLSLVGQSPEMGVFHLQAMRTN